MVNMVHVVIVVNRDKLDLQLQLVNFFNSSLRCCLKTGRHFKDSSTFWLDPKHQVDKVKSQVLSQKWDRNKRRITVTTPLRSIRSCDQDAEHKKRWLWWGWWWWWQWWGSAWSCYPAAIATSNPRTDSSSTGPGECVCSNSIDFARWDACEKTNRQIWKIHLWKISKHPLLWGGYPLPIVHIGSTKTTVNILQNSLINYIKYRVNLDHNCTYLFRGWLCLAMFEAWPHFYFWEFVFLLNFYFI